MLAFVIYQGGTAVKIKERSISLWTFIHEKRGILIPVRDRYGRIQGLQIRRDNVEKRKFRWVSSAEKKDGCKAEGWTHFSGPVRPMLVLTEGPMKADVINALTGLTVLAVPGVNIANALNATTDQLLAHEFSHPEEIYLKKISERIEKYPVSKRILACEGFNTYLDSLEKFSKT